MTVIGGPGTSRRDVAYGGRIVPGPGELVWDGGRHTPEAAYEPAGPYDQFVETAEDLVAGINTACWTFLWREGTRVFLSYDLDDLLVPLDYARRARIRWDGRRLDILLDEQETAAQVIQVLALPDHMADLLDYRDLDVGDFEAVARLVRASKEQVRLVRALLGDGEDDTALAVQAACEIEGLIDETGLVVAASP